MKHRAVTGDKRMQVAFIILVASVLLLGIAHCAPDSRMVERPREQTTTAQGELRAAESRFETPLWKFLANGLLLSLTAVACYEIVNVAFNHWVSRAREWRALSDFFGVDVELYSSAGQIVLQEDNIDKVLTDSGFTNATAIIDGSPKNRLYKARRWANAFDAEGAWRIAEIFRASDLEPPAVLIEKRGDNPLRAESRFQIAMGLGFHSASGQVFSELGVGWIGIAHHDRCGDALQLSERLLPVKEMESIEILKDDTTQLKTLMPRGWKHSTWKNGSSESDYAVIVRHASHDRGVPVRFVVAGFTEHGTSAAGRYLHKNWRELNRKFVTSKDGRAGRGNFLILIAGTSDRLDSWDLVHGFTPITPRRLADAGIECKWTHDLRTL